MKIKAETIARTIVAAIALLNAVLAMTGKAPLDLDESTIYSAVSVIASILTTVWVWWKNNSFTANALKADVYLTELREEASEK